MNLKLLLTKTLLVAAGLCAGVNGAWADEVVGTTSSDWNSAYSTTVEVADGGVLHYRFTQTTAAANNWDGFILIASNVSTAARYAFMRQDWYDGESPAGTFDHNLDTEKFIAGMNGATVDMTVSYSGGTLTVNSLVTYSTKYSYYYNFTKAIDGSPESINVCLSTYHAQLTITTSEYYDVKATLSHTASLCRNSTANPIYSKDAATEHYNNRASGGWQGFAYAEFDFSIPAGHSLVSADLIWTTAIAGNNNNWRNNDIDYMSADVDYDSFSSQTNSTVNNFNTSETKVASVSLYSGPYSKENAQAQTATTDVTSAVNAMITASKTKVIFRFTEQPAGADLWGKASKYAPVLVLKTTDEVLYTATFTETNSLSPTITIYSDAGRTEEVTNGTLHDATTYYYRAVLEGYNNYEGSFTVAAAAPSESFTMSAKTRYTFTVNAIDETSGVIKALYTDADSYEGKTHSMSFSKYLTGDGNVVTYSKDNDTYYASYTAQAKNETYTQAYTTYLGTAYFFEGETFGSLGTRINNSNCSGNTAARGLNNTSMNVLTVPSAGVYKITTAACNNSYGNAHYYNLYKNDDTGSVIQTNNLQYVTTTTVKTTGTVSTNNVVFAADDVLKFFASNTNVILDYMLIEKVTSESVTVSSAGFATYVSNYNLDYTGTAIKAYTAKVDAGKVVLSTLNKVKAGVPVLLYKDGGATESIPVSTTFDVVPADNELVQGEDAAVATDGTTYTNYILNNVSGIGFYKAAGQTVASNRAYLHTLTTNLSTGAPLYIFFDGMGNTTGVERLTPVLVKGEEPVYNLAGQRVAQPTKGLYIVNGKKVIVK